MKYLPRYSGKIKKQLQLAKKRGYDMQLFKNVVTELANGKTLPPRNRDHNLSGNWQGYRECHITPDWVLIYRIDGNELLLYLERTGTHSDLL
ncbi:MAG: type II toxin-antitoxin system YafQ family toxin [Clostridiales bacterium]|jgi:mRNA interferase YafQ|nr:type II toxin-antitoxin system YafQ family toxin [Clostridiales bacterium]